MSESTPRASATFSRVMSKTSLSIFPSTLAPPQLEELKLSHILNGETCPPISFADFAAYVAHQEYTTENLLFVVWYRNYRARFEALDNKTKAAVPVPSTRLGDRYTPFAYLDKAMAERKAAGSDQGLSDGGISFEQLVRVESKLPPRTKGSKRKSNSNSNTNTNSTTEGFKPCAWAADGTLVCDEAFSKPTSKPSLFSRLTSRSNSEKEQPPAPSILHSTLHPSLPPRGTVFTPPESQPMRAEAQRAFATFLRKGGSRELGISDELREYAKECLGRSTAPNVFLPIYEEIYQAVESQSLPRFLESAKRNINRPKELYWYAVGLADLCIGIIIFLILTLFLPAHPFGWRILRIFSTLFVSFGFMQAYSAYRGFCSQVWGRSSRQVRPWEMDELDDEEIRLESMPCDDRMDDRPVDEEVKVDLQNVAVAPKEGELPEGVHALRDLGGCVEDEGDSTGNSSPESPKTATFSTGLPELESEDMSPTQRRQMEIRQATVKAPPPHEAFPFVNEIAATPPQPSFVDSQQRHHISPFDTNYNLSGGPWTDQQRASEDRASINEVVRDIARRTSRDLSTLLVNLRRASAQPSIVARERSRTRSDATPASQADDLALSFNLDKDSRPKVFGPERLIEDPRVRKLMSSIVRDIFIVGGIAGAIWVVLCFAVPCWGLASR